MRDNEAPTFTDLPLADLTIGTNPLSCETDMIVEAPALDDNCDDNPVASWVVKEEDGSVVDAGTGVIGLTLEPGAYLVEWTGKDDCGNESEIEEQNLTVVDDDEPICYADQFTVVPLNDDGDGSVRVCADNLDSGSRDNCTVPELRIKKMNDSADTPFTKCITLSCADLDADCGSGVMVRFRAYDNIASTADAVPDVTFNLPEGGSARFSECMVQVALQDKKPPALSNPEDKALACEDIDADDLNALFDKPTATDNCDADPVVEIVSTTGGLNNCGVGAVTRTWVAVDKCGNRSPEVSQTVTVSSGATYTVTFPADVEVFNCDSDAALPTADGAGIPTVDGATAPCQNILISDPDTDGFEKRYTDQDGNCTKIVRTWCVMNWCVYDAARDNFKADPEVGERTFTDGGDGIICYTQVIKVVPAPAECSTVAEGTQFELDQPNNGDVFDPENFVEVNITADMIDDGSTGYDELKLDFGTGEVDDATFGCKDISLPGVPNNIPVDLILKIDGETALTCSTTIQVVDKVKPAIICGSTQQLVIPAADGELYTFSNDDVNRLTEVPFDNCGAVTAVFSPASLTFDAGSTQTVDITFSDPSGNTFTCTDIPVASSSITKPSIAGTIANENGEAVDEVMVEVNNGQMPGMMTKEDGAFEFTGLELNGSYTVTPEKDRNPLNGVSTFDLILISQHILGSQELSSPYQLIAADVNKSGGISVADMVEIRQLILNIISDYQSNTSWRFVDGDFEFSDPSDPWATPFPEVFNITDLSADQMDMSFVGVKVGDVDGNAIPNQRIATQGRTANGTLNLMAEDRFVQQGEQVVLSLSANEFASIQGFQFALDFDENVLEFVDVRSAALPYLDENNFGYTMVDEGVLTASWNELNGQALSLDNDSELFQIVFTAKASGQLSELIGLTQQQMRSEAYDATNGLLDLNIQFGNETANATFELYQNKPNPFNGITTVGFNLPTASNATITIYNVAGRTLRVIDGAFAKGYNEINLQSNELDATGILYYRLDTPTHTATRKMVILE